MAKPLAFSNLSLNDNDFEGDITKGPKDSDARLMEMLAAQAAAHQAGHGAEDDSAIADDEKLTDDEKKDALQKSLNMAASNGDVEKITKMLAGKAKNYINVNTADEDGTPPLIYASCFVCRPLPSYSLLALNPLPVMLTSLHRVTKVLSELLLTRVSMSTNRTRISGVL